MHTIYTNTDIQMLNLSERHYFQALNMMNNGWADGNPYWYNAGVGLCQTYNDLRIKTAEAWEQQQEVNESVSTLPLGVFLIMGVFILIFLTIATSGCSVSTEPVRSITPQERHAEPTVPALRVGRHIVPRDSATR